MVSIHAPHEGERPVDINDLAARISFQSTLPTRGSDDFGQRQKSKPAKFQSTLPTRGSDLITMSMLSFFLFQSTLPTRGSDSGKVHLYAAFPRIC